MQESKSARGTTHQFAELNLVKPQTVLKRFCETGSYFGIRPIKLASRRLDWPLVRIEYGQTATEGSSV